MEKILENALTEYYANDAKKLHSLVDGILVKFGGLSGKDIDDFYSLANEVFVNVIRTYNGKLGFDNFLYGVLYNKIKSEITRRNRKMRQADRMSMSIFSPINADSKLLLADVIVSDFDIKDELEELKEENSWSKEVEEYLNNLSPLQRKIALMISDDNTPDEICKELHITMIHYNNSVKRIFATEKIKVLRPLVYRKEREEY